MEEREPKPKVLIVDDTPENIDVLGEILKPYYRRSVALNGMKAIKIATSDDPPDLILLDIMMPEMDGYEVCRRLKADERVQDIPIIFVTAKTEVEDETKGFELGAVDYIAKPFSIPVVEARVRAHLELKKHRDREVIQREKLEALLGKLNDELADAADYVKFLLPEPLNEPAITTNWHFVPSTTLGGDALGYHWVDEDSFAIYLVDVCGHGVGAALHSVSVLNVLRSENLQSTDFRRPEEVLAGLNAVFPMESHKGMYFTIWYGVYNRVSRLLTYASGGHPAALLIEDIDEEKSKIRELKTPNLFIGGMPGLDFDSDSVSIEGSAKLYVFSDGVFEITDDNGPCWGFEDLVRFLRDSSVPGTSSIDNLWDHVTQIADSETLEDDFSVLEIVIPLTTR
jgi:phosphoserine phosphatase RsbU/P